MSLDVALEAHSQLAESRQPCVCALHDPAMTTEPVIALDTSASNATLNASALEVVSATREVEALVGEVAPLV